MYSCIYMTIIEQLAEKNNIFIKFIAAYLVFTQQHSGRTLNHAGGKWHRQLISKVKPIHQSNAEEITNLMLHVEPSSKSLKQMENVTIV